MGTVFYFVSPKSHCHLGSSDGMKFSATISSLHSCRGHFSVSILGATNGPIRQHKTHGACTTENIMRCRIALCGLGSFLDHCEWRTNHSNTEQHMNANQLLRQSEKKNKNYSEADRLHITILNGVLNGDKWWNMSIE